MGVEREAVAGGGPEALAVAGAQAPPARVHAAERAQEHERAQRRVLRAQVVPARGHRPDQHLGAGVGFLDRRPRGAHEPAVEVRRHRRAVPVRALRLRLQPRRQVRLVPDDVAVDVGAVARGDRTGEGGELALVGPGARTRHREDHLHPRGAHARDRRVEVAEAVALDPRRLHEDAHHVDAVGLPLRHRAVGLPPRRRAGRDRRRPRPPGRPRAPGAASTRNTSRSGSVSLMPPRTHARTTWGAEKTDPSSSRPRFSRDGHRRPHAPPAADAAAEAALGRAAARALPLRPRGRVPRPPRPLPRAAALLRAPHAPRLVRGRGRRPGRLPARLRRPAPPATATSRSGHGSTASPTTAASTTSAARPRRRCSPTSCSPAVPTRSPRPSAARTCSGSSPTSTTCPSSSAPR